HPEVAEVCREGQSERPRPDHQHIGSSLAHLGLPICKPPDPETMPRQGKPANGQFPNIAANPALCPALSLNEVGEEKPEGVRFLSTQSRISLFTQAKTRSRGTSFMVATNEYRVVGTRPIRP